MKYLVWVDLCCRENDLSWTAHSIFYTINAMIQFVYLSIEIVVRTSFYQKARFLYSKNESISSTLHCVN